MVIGMSQHWPQHVTQMHSKGYCKVSDPVIQSASDSAAVCGSVNSRDWSWSSLKSVHCCYPAFGRECQTKSVTPSLNSSVPEGYTKIKGAPWNGKKRFIQMWRWQSVVHTKCGAGVLLETLITMQSKTSNRWEMTCYTVLFLRMLY